ncbi:Lsr2 family protein [Nanchangia anserum]|uniref:Lsr2 family protein n=1 Tax=Nanchangia anserum TaxID=2692125 RepID=A0A8I0KQ13_9ACTO|nr:Lsr2 family protein [Nanchangia anserum]MBD3689480.1 Lsr2 family protein [Nanchangia anserum]QOX81673.1 Lsr2 family protein [Nanchangia anserum]
MAKQTTTILIDDITGEPADTTVKFGLDGVSYEIDLTTKNAEKLRSELRKWADAATRIGGRRTIGTPRGKSESAKIREWARERNIDVPARGRIPTKVRDAYYEAHA